MILSDFKFKYNQFYGLDKREYTFTTAVPMYNGVEFTDTDPVGVKYIIASGSEFMLRIRHNRYNNLKITKS